MERFKLAAADKGARGEDRLKRSGQEEDGGFLLHGLGTWM